MYSAGPGHVTGLLFPEIIQLHHLPAETAGRLFRSKLSCPSLQLLDRPLLPFREPCSAPSLALLPPGLALWTTDLDSHMWPSTKRGSVLVLMLYCGFLEVLNYFIVELLFCKGSAMGPWRMEVEKIHACFLLCPEFRRLHSVWELRDLNRTR